MTLPNTKKLKVVIAGGGTAGWLVAAAISKLIGHRLDICLVESDAIGRVGVGEATIPPLRTFHRLLGINEQDFMRETQATFKLGIEFKHWAEKSESYLHSFGQVGKGCWACDFQHFWVAGKQAGISDAFGDYCPEYVAAESGRMLAGHQEALNYAYHLDAGLYAKFLQKIAFENSVSRVEGIIKHVKISGERGDIESLHLDSGETITGDLFIDCTGFDARLIQGALNTGYESYASYLPCDSAVAIPTERHGSVPAYTQAIAHDFGWQWRIPLQHRAGNGLVYSSRYVSDDEAVLSLQNSLEGEPISQPRMFRYHTGRRQKTWHKNCVAIGLAAGFLEPVESTSIHLIMSSILRLIKFFPFDGVKGSSVSEFNRQSQVEVEQIRNFLILHYKATQRDDSAFWRYCKNMDIPAELENRIEMFRDTGIVSLPDSELFLIDSWTQVLLGQNVMPQSFHPIVHQMKTADLANFLRGIKASVNDRVSRLPENDAFIQQYCKASR